MARPTAADWKFSVMLQAMHEWLRPHPAEAGVIDSAGACWSPGFSRSRWPSPESARRDRINAGLQRRPVDADCARYLSLRGPGMNHPDNRTPVRRRAEKTP